MTYENAFDQAVQAYESAAIAHEEAGHDDRAQAVKKAIEQIKAQCRTLDTKKKIYHQTK